MSSSSISPKLSVIMITPDSFETLRYTLRYLQKQTVANELEIVIGAPSRSELGAIGAAAMAPFHSFQIVETGRIASSAVARSIAVRAAQAPLVVFTEDHSWPTPDWAAALIAAHQGPWAAVGPTVLNGNPASLVSWTHLLIEYGPWIEQTESGVRSHIPPHNSCYKRDLLLAFGSRLDQLIEAETVLQWALQAQGYQVYLETAAKTRHVNFSEWGTLIPLRFNVGLLFGTARARDWSVMKRMAYALASPLIPLVRLWRTLPVIRGCSRAHRLFPRILPLLLFSFIVDAIGEAWGYILCPNNSAHQSSVFEFHRDRQVRTTDKVVFAES